MQTVVSKFVNFKYNTDEFNMQHEFIKNFELKIFLYWVVQDKGEPKFGTPFSDPDS